MVFIASVLSGGAIAAGSTQIADAPLFKTSSVKPNIMFLMDDSGSMKRNFLPDDAVNWGHEHQYGLWSRHCNHMAYNPDPAVQYPPPRRADGTREPDADPSPPPSGTPFYYVYKGTEPDMGFVWNQDGSISWNNFMYECNSAIGSAPGSAVFDRVDVTAAEMQKYANWKRYYSQRREMTKAALKEVFHGLTSKYRIGFSLTSNPDAVDYSSFPGWPRWSFLDVRDYDNAQKANFFRALDVSDGDADTPLRGAVAKTGRYFAKKANKQTYDPVQRSCQRNFAILATDGGWTKTGEDPNVMYGPYDLDGVALGQQDNRPSLPRPIRDAGKDAVTTLADVALYYYETDLRTRDLDNCTSSLGLDACDNIVKKGEPKDAYHSGGDTADWQHLTLFTVGLGLSGTVKYSPSYLTDYPVSGNPNQNVDFHNIVVGKNEWPAIADPGTANDFMPLKHTDDMWHAAVNARGRHFNANSPSELVASLATALRLIDQSTGAGAAASTSSLQPTTTDNSVYLAQFTSQVWAGDLLAYTINPDDGTVSDASRWSAKTELDRATVTPGGRNILYRKPGANPGDALTAFEPANLRADGLDLHFDRFCARPGVGGAISPEQCGTLAPADLAAANNADQMVAYLRGDQSLTYYRRRASRLGDIINASPAFVGPPAFPYMDPDGSYDKFKLQNKGRKRVVLAAANDGMLHAFDDADGRELWAYVPSFVMPRMYQLADKAYADNHIYLVDGSPQVADIKVGGIWKTIVVGGLNAGGRGYYALDITDPASPRVMWEFEDDDLGYTFGNPVVVQRNDGSGDWVVVFGSGYNNVLPGDGKGHLYVLDAATGLRKEKLTAAGDSHGIVKINPWVDDETQNVARRFYGGDLQGHVWRFDIDDKVAPAGKEALELATLTDAAGNPQPVTSKPALAELKINGNLYPVVYVGTGKYLGVDDITDKSPQTLYAIKDPLTASGHGVVRPHLVKSTVTTGSGDARKVDAVTVDWSSKIGWFMDFPENSERVMVDPAVVLDKLYVASNVPESNSCKEGGTSYLYTLDLTGREGWSTPSYPTLVLGFTMVGLKNALGTYMTGADGRLIPLQQSRNPSASGLRRVSWREIVD